MKMSNTTDEAKAALGYLVGDLNGTYRKRTYAREGSEAMIQRSDGKCFIVRVFEILD